MTERQKCDLIGWALFIACCLLALCCSGCATHGDPVHLEAMPQERREIERIRMERFFTSKTEQDEAEEKLQRMIGAK